MVKIILIQDEQTFTFISNAREIHRNQIKKQQWRKSWVCGHGENAVTKFSNRTRCCQ